MERGVGLLSAVGSVGLSTEGEVEGQRPSMFVLLSSTPWKMAGPQRGDARYMCDDGKEDSGEHSVTGTYGQAPYRSHRGVGFSPEPHTWALGT